jgi:hypothetical protein
VLTEDGWVRWQDYDYQSPLGTMNPATGHLEFQSPLARHVYDYDGPLYYSDNQSVDFAVTPNHRMYVRKWDESRRELSDKYCFVEAQKLGWYAGLPHATSGWAGTELERLGVGDHVYQGDDFLSLVAAVVSCGWVGGSESTKNSVSFCCFREERQEMLRALAHRVGLREQPSRPGVFDVKDGALAEWFRQNAFTDDAGAYRSPFKRVPALVKCASQRQIELFFTFFGDQHVEERGDAGERSIRRFYSSSGLMIDDLQELLLRIGKRGTVEERPPREPVFKGRRINSNGPDLTLTERRTERLSLERKKHLRTDYYKGKVYCATVPNGLLVTRRNKKILISSNSCWDFSGTCVAESAFIKQGTLKNDGTGALSEQYTLDCTSNGGCNGDDNTTVLQNAKSKGLPLTSSYGPYQTRAGQCKLQSTMKLFQLTDWGYVGPQQGVGDTQAIKNAMKQYGPIGCAVAADNSFSNYHGGVFEGSGSQDIDHDVVLVGWDDSKGAWKMRNSWNTSWGDQGYMWIKYGANQIGYAPVFAVAPAGPGPAPDTPIDWGNA